MSEAEDIAAQAGPVLKAAILHIADGGERGVTTDFWDANWFSVVAAHRRDPRLFTGFSKADDRDGRRVTLTPFGREVAEALRSQATSQ